MIGHQSVEPTGSRTLRSLLVYLERGQKQLPETCASFSLPSAGRAGEGGWRGIMPQFVIAPLPNPPRRGEGVQIEVGMLFLSTSLTERP